MTTEEFKNSLRKSNWHYKSTKKSIDIISLAIVSKDKQEVKKRTTLCNKLNDLVNEYVNTPIEER